jgi:hypothetical protein
LIGGLTLEIEGLFYSYFWEKTYPLSSYKFRSPPPPQLNKMSPSFLPIVETFNFFRLKAFFSQLFTHSSSASIFVLETEEYAYDTH